MHIRALSLSGSNRLNNHHYDVNVTATPVHMFFWGGLYTSRITLLCPISPVLYAAEVVLSSSYQCLFFSKYASLIYPYLTNLHYWVFGSLGITPQRVTWSWTFWINSASTKPRKYILVWTVPDNYSSYTPLVQCIRFLADWNTSICHSRYSYSS